ncbi:hypothetical protein Pla22_25480 [Rubripirellula amarantea]|uniref:Uncharacterized protein n=1 Tax=Rubripirellula amarantea TaxID=2527999 RepID=A0A5C5WVC4_9BACT|nr:hypothetical protein [Rubripirellula amarantea]TWT54894.1 hypothetical protein Pla22_25480 [Rubripirellula amarantea]
MDETNPEIESTLNELAKLVCESLKGENQDLIERRDGLLKSLLMSGYVWKSNEGLMTNVENRVKDQCGEQAMHRGGALSSITGKLATKFRELAQWESRTPNDDNPPKAANISSATDA